MRCVQAGPKKNLRPLELDVGQIPIVVATDTLCRGWKTSWQAILRMMPLTKTGKRIVMAHPLMTNSRSRRSTSLTC